MFHLDVEILKNEVPFYNVLKGGIIRFESKWTLWTCKKENSRGCDKIISSNHDISWCEMLSLNCTTQHELGFGIWQENSEMPSWQCRHSSPTKVLPPLLDPDCTSNFETAEWGTRNDGTTTSKPGLDDHSSPCSAILSKSLSFSISLPIKWSY